MPEIQIILLKGMRMWLQMGEHHNIWTLQNREYKDDLKNAIRAQNYIGWNNIFKGCLVRQWGDIQTKHYHEIYKKIPPYLSANVVCK